jgi:hypothetical protein
MTLLTRLQTSKTDKYTLLFTRFLLFVTAVNVEGLSPDYLIGTMEEVQPQCALHSSQIWKTPDYPSAGFGRSYCPTSLSLNR